MNPPRRSSRNSWRGCSIHRRLFGLLLLCPWVATAQAPSSRTREIEQARDEKTARLEPDTPSRIEQRLIYIKDAKVLERITAGLGGLRLKIGGMPTGSGFALGPDYLRNDLARGNFVFNAGVQASSSRWVNLYVNASAPAFARDRLFWEGRTAYRDFNSLPYYGPGPDSERSARTNYRLEETTLDTMGGVRPHKRAWLGAGAGYLKVNVGPGASPRYASSDATFRSLFQTLRIPSGLERQTGFFRTGFFAHLDLRDNPAGPRAGVNWTLRYDQFRDQSLGTHDFRRLDVEAQHYLPLFNKRRAIALRGRTVQSFTRPGQFVPFYQQAVLGGGNDLRGFRPYRFHDNNMIVMNGEYRWEVFAGLDMALFFDAGRVSPRRWQFGFSQMETSAGFGLRFNVRNATFMRIDVGFSHEGFQVFVKFNGIFGERLLGTSSAPHLY